jgi:hypothetical protein
MIGSSSSQARRPARHKSGYVLIARILAGAMLVSSVPAAAQTPSYLAPSPSLPDRAQISQLVVRYLTTWNERDPQKRREAIANVWATDGIYVDPNRSGTGRDAINALVEKAQLLFPAPYALRLVSTIEIHHGFVRFSWAGGGLPDAPLYLAGTDFMRLTNDGHVQSVTGFADAPAIMQMQAPR